MLKAALCGSYVNFGVFRLYGTKFEFFRQKYLFTLLTAVCLQFCFLGDDALDNALNSFVKLLLSIPQSDLLVSWFHEIFVFFMKFCDEFLISRFFFALQDYPKLSQTYYVLLECLAQDHMSFLATMVRLVWNFCPFVRKMALKSRPKSLRSPQRTLKSPSKLS